MAVLTMPLAGGPGPDLAWATRHQAVVTWQDGAEETATASAAGLRMAYVEQHAFHHLEKHMQATPTQYIMWRLAGNDDKESLEFKSRERSVDEVKARAQKWCIDSVTGDVRRCVDPREDAKKAKQDEAAAVIPDAVLGRRQKKKEKTYEYEVRWQFKPIESNCWVVKELLVTMGYLKLLHREDERQAAVAGLMTKQPTQPSIEKHLGDFGVDSESASHAQTNQLSGGMKVNVVLAASMWQNPHIIIQDEPTNNLDREGLGALVLTINDYKGGVLIIPHDKEFCDGVATEQWIMRGGYLRTEGESKADEDEKDQGNVAPDEVKKTQALSSKDAQKAIKDLEKKLKDCKKKKALTDEDMWEMENVKKDGVPWPASPSGISWNEANGKIGSGKKFDHNIISAFAVKTVPFYKATIMPVIHF